MQSPPHDEIKSRIEQNYRRIGLTPEEAGRKASQTLSEIQQGPMNLDELWSDGLEQMLKSDSVWLEVVSSPAAGSPDAPVAVLAVRLGERVIGHAPMYYTDAAIQGSTTMIEFRPGAKLSMDTEAHRLALSTILGTPFGEDVPAKAAWNILPIRDGGAS